MENKIVLEMSTIQTLKKSWVIYSIFHWKTAKVVYVGMCKMNVLFALPDFQGLNTDTILENDAFSLKIINISDDKKEALKLHVNAIREHGVPDLNKYGHYKKRRSRIQCVETGEIWNTIQECARVQGIDPGALSRHLRALPGHVTVRGMTYMFVNIDK